MRPELEKSRTPEQLAEIFRQLAGEPLTSLLSAPVLRYTDISNAGAGAEDLLRMSGIDYPYVDGAEKNMLIGDFAFLIEMIADGIRKKAYGSKSEEPLKLIEDMMLIFPIWACYSDTLKKGVRM